MDYEVRLDIFEGPLDLLLHLIRKNEVDIFDIPIATITDQYLAYIDIMEALNITLAGEFLVMASTLIHIKSRMLLPGLGEEEEDPRLEITRPLMEYMKFKELAGSLSERDMLYRDVFTRQFPSDYKNRFRSEEPLIEVSLFQLIDAFKRVMEQRLPGEQLKFQIEPWSLKEKTTFIINQLKERGALYFNELFSEARTAGEFIITFLSILELVQMGLVRVFQTDPEKDIRLEPHFKEEEETDDEVA
ncbi:MAG: segregation/condensation protein A [Deltaproteobacteria bacterium]|nr:segregation/condensation protein A [Deltaproteobacteria bacterium]